MQRFYFTDISAFSRTILSKLNQSKSVKYRAFKICHMSRTKSGRALIIVVNDRYKVALPISLNLKASNIFPIGNFGSNMVQNWNFWENWKKIWIIEKFCKDSHVLICNVFQTWKYILCQNFVDKYLFNKNLGHFQFLRVWPWKKVPNSMTS